LATASTIVISSNIVYLSAFKKVFSKGTIVFGVVYVLKGNRLGASLEQLNNVQKPAKFK